MKFLVLFSGPILTVAGGVATGIFGTHEMIGSAMILVGGVGFIFIAKEMIMFAEETKREAAGREYFMRHAPSGPAEDDVQPPIPGLGIQV
jgi:hypothetical protein